VIQIVNIVPTDEIRVQGREARRNGVPLASNPWFGGGKREAASQLKWEIGWKEEDELARRRDAQLKFTDNLD